MVTSIILAGGNGRRLGQNKLKVILGKEYLIQRVLNCILPLSEEVLVVLSRKQEPLPFQDKVREVVDIYPGRSALGGIYTGLTTSRSFHNLVVACDMPFLNTQLLHYMIDLAPSFDAVVPRIGGMSEPLHALYSKNYLICIKRQIEQDDLKVGNLFKGSLKIRYVEEDEVKKFDPQFLSFFNVNTPNDLEMARKLAGREFK
jgi:molybdopterin-guanine dinucleotide biosynthesis protein A